MGAGGGASCLLYILMVSSREGKWFLTSDTEQGAAAQTSEVDRAAIPMRLAVQCQCLGQCSSPSAATNVKVGEEHSWGNGDACKDSSIGAGTSAWHSRSLRKYPGSLISPGKFRLKILTHCECVWSSCLLISYFAMGAGPSPAGMPGVSPSPSFSSLYMRC